ncbi:MAG TPA: hypothetical protein VF490_16565 [Chryseosolibacter sp.]
MKKSEIVVAVFTKSHPTKTEKQVLRDLTALLSDQSVDMDQWDVTVPDPIAKSMIRNIGSARGELVMEYVVRDIDIILKRISV